MPIDAITLHSLAKELNASLNGQRIAKIYQNDENELALVMRNGKRLQISADPSLPYIYLTKEKKENTLNAPSFQMLARKHIGSGKIEGVELVAKDRVIRIAVACYSEMHDKATYHLYIELMGRYSNIILVNPKGLILDALKRTSIGVTTTRLLMPNLKYIPQHQEKVAPDDLAGLGNAVKELTAQDNLNVAGLIGKISGISKETAKEVLARAKENTEIPLLISYFYSIADTANYAPCVTLDKQGQAQDAFICPYISSKAPFLPMSDLNAAFERVYSVKGAQRQKEQDTKGLRKTLKRLVGKNNRRLEKAQESLKQCAKIDEYKKYGELLTANLHNFKGKEESITVFDYYLEKEIAIPLDAALTPQKNIESYFKRYKKLKRAKEVSAKIVQEAEHYKEYLDSIENAINICNTKEELLQIEAELAQLTAPVKKLPKAKGKPAMPNKAEYKGYAIYYGKNNKQNDTVTFEIASPEDIWLHIKDGAGAHVVIKGRQIPDEVLKEGARIAATQSGASGKCEVVWCKRRYVKKLPGGGLGQVTYKNFKSILVDI